MRTIKLLTVLLALMTLGTAASAQEKTIKQERPVAEFTSISIDQPVKVVLNQGGIQTVSIEAPEAIQDKIKVKVESGELSFEMKGGETENVKIFITASNLSKIKTGSAAVITGEGEIKSEKLDINAGGASNIDLGVDVVKLSTDISGAAEVVLKGKADQHKSKVSGAANLKAGGLQTKTTDITVSGASYADVDATEELGGSVSGAANLNYKNKPPKYNVEASGAASSEEADTTKLHLGDKQLFIFDKDHPKFKDFADREHPGKCHKDSKVGFKIAGIDFGVNGYVNDEFKFQVPAGRAYLEPNYGRSFSVGLDVLNVGIPLVRKHIKLWFGPGFEFNNYFFRTDYLLGSDSSTINATVVPGINYDKNKLTVTWFRIPVLMTFNFKSFNFSLGVIGAVRMNSYTKHTWKADGEAYNLITKDDYFLNPYKADATFRIGFGPVNLFANYTFTGMYRNGHGPELYPITMGLTYSLFSQK